MTPSSWRIKPLPQRNRPDAYGVLLIAENGDETQIGMSSATEQGIRSQMRRHPDYRGVPEDRPLIGAVVERFSTAGVVPSGPYFVEAISAVGKYRVALYPDPLDWPDHEPTDLITGGDA